MFVKMQAIFVIKNDSPKILAYSDAVMKNGTKRSFIGERIAQARLAAGLSQERLAKKLGVTQQMVGYLEVQPVAIRPELLARLSVELRVSIEDLLGIESSPRRSTGPTGKMRQVFEAASRLSRSQQQHIIRVLEPFVREHAQDHKQAA